MTRIIGGSAAMVRLAVPPRGTRPTSDKVREAMFSTLSASFEFTDARVLDLYAGSGALGLEALSRGAEYAVLVERSERAAALLRANAAAVTTKTTARARIEVASVESWLARAVTSGVLGEFDLVFVDPPYDLATETVSAQLELAQPLLSADALVVVERSTRGQPLEAPSGYALWREKTYGETSLRYFEVAA